MHSHLCNTFFFVPGALVVLADGRFAYTGPIKAIGSARQLQEAARKRVERGATDAERAWGREVIGALEGEPRRQSGSPPGPRRTVARQGTESRTFCLYPKPLGEVLRM